MNEAQIYAVYYKDGGEPRVALFAADDAEDAEFAFSDDWNHIHHDFVSAERLGRSVVQYVTLDDVSELPF